MATRDKAKHRAESQRYRNRHKKAIAARQVAARLRDPRPWILGEARRRAREQGIPCELTKEDVVIPQICPVLGLVLQVNVGRAKDNSPSLDRLVPALGYIRGNVRVISFRANTLKSNATAAELTAVLEDLRRIEGIANDADTEISRRAEPAIWR